MTGGWGVFKVDGSWKSVYLTTTEIYQGGEWREVGPLPVGLRGLRGATLDNSVFMTGERGDSGMRLGHDQLSS